MNIPLVIEFCGMPNSGKSTLIRKLNRFASLRGYKCIALSEGVRNSPVKPKGRFGYNLWGILTLTSRLLEVFESKPDMILLDRGPTDLTVFSTILLKNKLLSRSESNTLQKISKLSTTLISGYFLFLVNPRKSLSRDDKHSIDKNGIVMNPIFLGDLYTEYKAKLRKEALIIIYSDKEDINRLSKMLETKIINLLKERN